MRDDNGPVAGAALLTTTLSSAPAPLDIESMLAVAPVRRRIRHTLPILDVPYFLYRVHADGTIVPMHGHWRRDCEHPRPAGGYNRSRPAGIKPRPGQL